MICGFSRSFALVTFAVHAVTQRELGLHYQSLGQVCLDRLSGAQPLAQVGDTGPSFDGTAVIRAAACRLSEMVGIATPTAAREGLVTT